MTQDLFKTVCADVLTLLHRTQLAYLTSGYMVFESSGTGRCYWGLCRTFEKLTRDEMLSCVFTNLLVGLVDTPDGSTWKPRIAFMPIQDYSGNWYAGPEDSGVMHLIGRSPSPLISLAIQTRTTLLNRMIEALEGAIDRKARAG